MKYVYIILMAFFLSIVPALAQKYEYRAVWLTTLGGLDWPKQHGVQAQKAALVQMLDTLQTAHFNTVLFQIRNRGHVVYPNSAIEPLDPVISPDYDALAFAIEECHKRGMQLHVWMVSIPRYKGHHDPASPATSRHLVALAREVTQRYDIDGLHLDYIRYPERGRFRGTPQQKRQNITHIVRQIYHAVKAIKPWVRVSSSPLGKYADTDRYPSRGWNAMNSVYQEAQAWLQEGIHDVVFPMLYYRGNNFYPFLLDWQENSAGRPVVAGLGIYFMADRKQDWPLEEVSRQIQFSRQVHAGGQAFFRCRFLTDNVKGLLTEIKERYYVHPAMVHPLPTSQPAPDAPTQAQFVQLPDGSVSLGWTGSPGLTYQVYASSVYPVDVADGENLLATYYPGTQMSYRPQGTERYYAVTAVDRYGQESVPLPLNQAEPGDVFVLNRGNQLLMGQGTIYDTNNQAVMDITSTDLSSLPPGFYIVKSQGKVVGTIVK